MKHALNAIAINRAKRPTKLIDGSGLFYQRNRDGSLTPWQRLRQPGGKSRDVKVAAPVLGEITTDWLLNIRHRAFALKTCPAIPASLTAPCSSLNCGRATAMR